MYTREHRLYKKLHNTWNTKKVFDKQGKVIFQDTETQILDH